MPETEGQSTAERVAAQEERRFRNVVETSRGLLGVRSFTSEAEKETLSKLGGFTSNRKRHSNFASHYETGTPQMKQGYIIPSEKGDIDWRFNFSFNPAQISYGYSINEEIPPQDTQSEASREVTTLVDGADIQLQLFFDRRQEVGSSADTRSKGVTTSTQWAPERIGVLHDMMVLNQVIQGENAGANNPGVLSYNRLLDLVLSPSIDEMTYTGYLAVASWNFVAFSYDMIPVTADLTLGFKRRFGATGTEVGGYGEYAQTPEKYKSIYSEVARRPVKTTPKQTDQRTWNAGLQS